MDHHRHRKATRPLDQGGLERLALFYAGRYATTRAKLRAYLTRKISEKGWSGENAPAIDALVARFDDLGYVNDKAFAEAKAVALGRSGYGERRVSNALRAAGIAAEDGAGAEEIAAQGAWEAALRFARRKRIGPYADAAPDRVGRQKAFAAMVRAGHRMDIVRRIVDAPPGAVPNEDSDLR